MIHDPDKYHRRSIRLPSYDYASPGGYFITICTHNRQNLFGEIVDGEMVLNEYGEIVRDEWAKTSIIRSEIELDQFIIMPNHIHGIVFIFNENCINKNHHENSNIVGADGRPPLQRRPRSIGSLIAGFKSACTKQINIIRNTPTNSVWQRNYYRLPRCNRGTYYPQRLRIKPHSGIHHQQSHKMGIERKYYHRDE